jgi:hypothetical protein
LWYRWKRSKPTPFTAFCVQPWAYSEPIFHKTYDSLA